MTCTALSTSPASPMTLTASPSSPRTPLRKSRWSSTITTRGTASPSLKVVLSSPTPWTLPTNTPEQVAPFGPDQVRLHADGQLTIR